MRYFALYVFCFQLISLFSQGPIITPLNSNANLRNGGDKITKRQLGDTLILPFMDEFITTEKYPDLKIWIDKQAYVNRHFAVSPPSFGVATLDNLDPKGRPYQNLSGLTHNHCDSLTTRAINLKDYISLSTTINYTLADSIYLSFFYQTQGLGDMLDNSDSLVLKFKDKNGFWQTVWKTPGTGLKPFKQILVGINDEKYLFNGFQFRFINYSKSTGNMNQWHLDYIRMDADRNMFDTVIHDVAIIGTQSPLLWFENMPYDHFKANPVYHTAGGHKVFVKNNFFGDKVNLDYTFQVRNTYNQLIFDYPTGSSGRNVPASGEANELFNQLQLDTFSGKEPIIKINYKIAPQSDDYTAGNYSTLGPNNELTRTVRFKNYFAYDDGSAEGGYGLDYGSLPSGPGYAAIKFYSYKPDTLRGIKVFFNRSVTDVSNRPFYLMVWSRLSEPPSNNTKNDVIARKVEILSTLYADSINGFVDFVFDTAVVLPVGDFYIGWMQTSNYILNVGYDNNYKIGQTGGKNTNLFYNLNGYWESVNANISGAVMMRPIVGAAVPKNNGTSVNELSRNSDPISIYPNPSGSSQSLSILANKAILSVRVFDLLGKLNLNVQSENISNIDISSLLPGIYILEMSDEFGNLYRVKYIKN